MARNQQRDVWKSAAHRTSAPVEEASDRGLDATSPLDDLAPDALPDRRLALLLVCAHPAIDVAVRTPLMLQTVLGFEAAQVATAFAVPPATMAQRLVRAKRRIKDARIPFVVPDRTVLRERLPAVLEAVYGCYAIAPTTMGDEAQYLAVTLATLLDDDGEAWGLAALVTLSRARADARTDGYVPLHEQDPSTWNGALIAQGEAYLRRAGDLDLPGRLQLEAAVQAVHCDRARTAVTDWTALRTFYIALLAVAPTLGGEVALAAVEGQLDGSDAGPVVGLHRLDALPAAAQRLQPWHATRADLLARAGRTAEAVQSYLVAASLTDDPSVREYLVSRRATLD